MKTSVTPEECRAQVVRLRKIAPLSPSRGVFDLEAGITAGMLELAAAEIERLTAENQKLHAALDGAYL